MVTQSLLCDLRPRSDPNHQLWLLPQLQQLAPLQPVISLSLILQLPVKRIHHFRKRDAHLQPGKVDTNTHPRPDNKRRRIRPPPSWVHPARGLKHLGPGGALHVARVPREGPDVSRDVDPLGNVDSVDRLAGADPRRAYGRGRHEAHRLLEHCVEVRQLGDRVACDVFVLCEPVAHLVLQPCEAVGVGRPREVPCRSGEGCRAGFGAGCEEAARWLRY